MWHVTQNIYLIIIQENHRAHVNICVFICVLDISKPNLVFIFIEIVGVTLYWKVEFSNLMPHLGFCFFFCGIRESSFSQVCAGEGFQLTNACPEKTFPFSP
jgi:hypothetical protein